MRYQDCITLTRILQGKIFQGFDFLYGKFLHFVKAANIQPNKALSFPRFKSGIRIFLQIKPPAKKSVEIPPVLVIFLCFVTFLKTSGCLAFSASCLFYVKLLCMRETKFYFSSATLYVIFMSCIDIRPFFSPFLQPQAYHMTTEKKRTMGRRFPSFPGGRVENGTAQNKGAPQPCAARPLARPASSPAPLCILLGPLPCGNLEQKKSD